ncbi:UNVERIFIED_CONTAM: hypothetical protein Sradi_5933200 [Sesamum radiatum]|uniref:Uncharacterized protein n=1 Tax=Sesamum radiatum TaxID=300843 RepID=A0AAW2KU80_SESRA
MDVITLYILCVSVVIVLLGLLNFIWLKFLEHRVPTLRMRRTLQIYGYTNDGRDTEHTSSVERYGGTVTAPSPPLTEKTADKMLRVIMK